MIAPTSFFADYGCHVRILEEIRSLQRRGHEVELCTYHNGSNVPNLTIHRTIDIPWRKRELVGSSKHKMYLDLALVITVLRRVRAFKPDIIHAHLHEGALIGSIAGRIFHVPVVFDYQGSLTEEMIDHGFLPASGLRVRFFRWLERRINAMPDVIVPSSNVAASYLAASDSRTAPVRVVPDAVNLDRFNPATAVAAGREMREKLGIPPTATVVVYLGLLAGYQGTPTLIEAADLFLDRQPDAYVVIAGYPGVGRHARMASTSKHADRILFPGRIDYDDAPALLAAADVAAAPKRSVTEANGKVLNYMAMQLPTTCSDTPVNRDLLGDLGHYVPPDDPEALSRALERALAAAPETKLALRERVTERFSWDTQILRLERIYRRLLGESTQTEPAITPARFESPASDD